MIRARSSGFTLIELMVVTVIIAIMIAVTAFSLPDMANRDIEGEARRLHALIRYAEDASILRNQDLVLNIESPGGVFAYSFLQYDYASHAWTTTNDQVLHARTLPDGVGVQLFDERLASGPGAPDGKQSDRIVFVGSGMRTPFELHLSSAGSDGALYKIKSLGMSGAVLEKVL